MSHANGYVRTDVQDAVAIVEFFHPQSNSLPGAILQELALAITEAGANPEARLIILRSGSEKSFCAGASFDELVAIQDEAGGLKFFSGFAHVINAIRTCGKLVIGRVQGAAVGGGVGLAAAVDYCIATEAARIKLSELAVGIGPFVVGPAVERKVGTAAFSALAIDATGWRDARWAEVHGLYAEVHPDIPTLDAAITRLADILKTSSPEAMTELKTIFWQGTDSWSTLLTDRAGISGRLVLSDFTRNAIATFKAKAAKN